MTLFTFANDTGTGLSGWATPLLYTNLETDGMVDFRSSLAFHIGNNSSKGRAILTATILVPLAKANGGVRPIAVGELIYRFAARILLAPLETTSTLLLTQLGVGSALGVEPIVHAVERLAEDLVSRISSETTSGSLHGTLKLPSIPSLDETLRMPSIVIIPRRARHRAGDIVMHPMHSSGAQKGWRR